MCSAKARLHLKKKLSLVEFEAIPPADLAAGALEEYRQQPANKRWQKVAEPVQVFS